MVLCKRLLCCLLLLLCLCPAAHAAPFELADGLRFGDTESEILSKASWAPRENSSIPHILAFSGEFAEIPETTAVCYLGSAGKLCEVVLHLCGSDVSGTTPGSLDEDTASLCYRLALAELRRLYGEPETTGEGRLDPPGESGIGLSTGAHEKYDETLRIANKLAQAGYTSRKKSPKIEYHSYAVWNIPSDEGTVNIQLETVSETNSAKYVTYGTNLYIGLAD